MEQQNDGRRRLNGAAISERELDLHDIQEAMEVTDDIQLRQVLARRAQHLMTELETGYAQPFEDEED